MNVKLVLWVLSVLFCGMAWPAGTPSALANARAGSSSCVDDTWTATSLVGVPSARWYHTAVWTDTEMIVWGGSDRLFGDGLNTGGRYDPTTDSWTPTSTLNAPSARQAHKAVWTGTEMIVWGGAGSGGYFNTGGRYDPVTDTWVAISTVDAPSARFVHTAVWTGKEMLVWGGGYYDERGIFVSTNTGGRYDPATDTWAATSLSGAPRARRNPTAVWTGTEMIVWGGGFNTGGRYDPITDTWTATSLVNAPSVRGSSQTAVWTGTEMIVWGGDDAGTTGGRYDPATDTWAAISMEGAPSNRENHTAVWTGTEMLVWGGSSKFSPFYFNTGGRYNPATDTWAAISTDGAPSARAFHTAVWTDTEMLVWGGFALGPTYFNTGGRYCARAGNKSER